MSGTEITPDACLDLALAAERWIDRQSVTLGEGRVWAVAQDAPADVDLTIYRGAAGIALFYLELAAATGTKSYLDRAAEAADTILAATATAPVAASGIYRGNTGLAFLYRQVYEATGLDAYQDAAHGHVERVIGAAAPCGDGFGWIEPIPFADAFGVEGTTEIWDVSRGSSGIGLALLWAHEQDLHPEALRIAEGIGRRLLEVATPAETGCRWPMMLEDVDWWAPNFSHGTAGTAFFLARLAAVTGDGRFLEAAVDGGRHVCSVATVEGRARKVAHSQDRGESLFYLGWCHGPPGTTRLFDELARVTGDDEWNEWTVGGGEAMLDLGVPEQRTRGYWNNVGQCCGDAAVGELAVSLWETAGDERFLGLARRVAGHLDAHSRRSEGMASWLQAEHRVKPDLLEAQTGYMQGAAGVGSFLLRLWGVETGHRTKIQLPDCPFPGR